MYEVFVGEQESYEYESREEAVSEAKRLSSENRRRIRVEGLGGRERFTYWRGELENYLYDLR